MQSAARILETTPAQCVIYFALTDAQTIQGRVYSKYYHKLFQFNNELELIRGLNEMFDSIGFPQITCQPRSFFDKPIRQNIRKAEDTVDNTLDEVLENPKTTFIVNVQYRQNASWQGSITWVEQDKKRNFRSALEMMELMEQAAYQGKMDVVSWEE